MLKTIVLSGLPGSPTSPKTFGELQKAPSSHKVKGPKPTFTSTLENLEVNEGEDVTLQIKSGPEAVTKMEWFKDNELLRDQGRFKITSVGNLYKLVVSPIEWEDEGIYKCVLLNDFGLSSCSAEVLVEGERCFELVLCCVLYCFVLCCVVLYFVVLYCVVLYCSVLCCIVLHGVVLLLLWKINIPIRRRKCTFPLILSRDTGTGVADLSNVKNISDSETEG